MIKNFKEAYVTKPFSWTKRNRREKGEKGREREIKERRKERRQTGTDNINVSTEIPVIN